MKIFYIIGKNKSKEENIKEEDWESIHLFFIFLLEERPEEEERRLEELPELEREVFRLRFREE